MATNNTNNTSNAVLPELAIELKENSVEGTAAAAGKPTKHYLTAAEFEILRTFVNYNRALIDEANIEIAAQDLKINALPQNLFTGTLEANLTPGKVTAPNLAETILHTVTIPANSLNIGNVLHIRAHLYCNNTLDKNYGIRLSNTNSLVGAVSLFQSLTITNHREVVFDKTIQVVDSGLKVDNSTLVDVTGTTLRTVLPLNRTLPIYIFFVARLGVTNAGFEAGLNSVLITKR